MSFSAKNGPPTSEDIYGDMFDNIGSPILIVNPETAAILGANKAACNFYGYPHSDLTQKRILDLAALPAAEVWQRISKIAAGEITHMSLQHRMASGEVRDVEVFLGIDNFKNKPVIISTIHNVTEQKQAALKLGERVKELNAFYSMAQIVEEEGYQPEHIYERVINMLPQSWQYSENTCGRLVVNGRQFATANFKDTQWRQTAPIKVKGNVIGSIEIGYLEPRPQADDGPFLNEERLLLDTIAERLGKIAARLITEKEFFESETRYHALFNNMREGFALQEIIQDESGRVVDFRLIDANPAYEWHTGKKLGEIIGRTLRETTPNADPVMIERYGKVALTGEPLDFEYYSKTFNRYIHVRAYRPRPNYFATIFEDITDRKQAEEAVRESEEKYRAFVEESMDGVAFVNEQGNISEWNRARENLTGLKKEDVIGKPYWDVRMRLMMPELRSPELLEKYKKAMLEMLRGGESQFFHHINQGEMITATGEHKFIEQISFPIKSIHGFQVCLLTRDVTDHRKAEADLKAAHDELEVRVQERTSDLHQAIERLNLATDAAKMGIWDWDIKKNELRWDQQMYTLYGVEPEDFGGAYEAWLSGIHPDDREASAQASEQARNGSQPYDTEFRVLWPDGSAHWLKADGQVFWDEQGTPARMLGVNYDITERKQAEEKLRRISYLLAEGQKIAHLGSFEYIVATQQTVWSDEQFRIYGYDSSQHGPDLKTILANNIPSDERDLIGQTFMTAIQSGEVFELEHHILLPDGSVRWVYDSAHPDFDQAGRLTRYIGVSLDITERKQAEKKLTETNIALEKALRVKDEFMAIMSHELRTPINGIMGTTELLKLTGANTMNEKQLSYLTIIEKSSQHLLDMVNSVLEFTQIQGNVLKPDVRPYMLGAVCEVALRKTGPMAELKQQHTQSSITPPDLTIFTDEDLLRKVLEQLLDNASKFTAAGGEFGVVVLGRPDAGLVDITIWDTGIGIAEENFQHLFKPFTQLDPSLSRQYEGAGLGLALAKSLTELLDGTLTFQSALGQGSRFTVTLPWK